MIYQAGQQWEFQLASATSRNKSFHSSFFTLTVEEAKKEEYDIIVIGTGIGAGIVAGDLFDTNAMLGDKAKRILVIEKGGLTFHSHCLNAARPSGLNQDRGQQNDTFFSEFRDNYTFSKDMTDKDLKDWRGGPMYTLGGRSAAWGLFIPRIHDTSMRRYFPETVCEALLHKYYREAETLMDLSLPTTEPVHEDLMERLNMDNDPVVQWQWGRIASEFKSMKNFDYAQGAYSTIDKLLEIAMSKPIRNGFEEEYRHFKMLLDTEVRSIIWSGSKGKSAAGVRIRTCDGRDDTIKLSPGGQIVLGAGTVNSAAILLRSQVDLESKGGLHVTDHDIFSKTLPFHYLNPDDRERVGSMKIQSYVQKVNPQDPQEVILANISIDASSFLPRGDVMYDSYPKWIMAFIRSTELNPKNMVKLVDDEPVVTVFRTKPFDESQPDLKSLRSMTEDVVKATEDALKLKFIRSPADDQGGYFQPLELGGVAHELGTVPMKQADAKHPFCVDEHLKLDGYEGLYVCDLSVFPYSPEVNPTLTLAGLALRLSREQLLPRTVLYDDQGSVVELNRDTVYVVNHGLASVQVWIANRADAPCSDADKAVVLQPGQYHSVMRKRDIPESVSVYKLQYNSTTEFVIEPELRIAHPGKMTSIII